MAKFFLVGMPGSGKTTIGKRLAKTLDLPLIDLDVEIEKEENATIVEIFSLKGEAYFREVESRLLHKFCDTPDSFVMATGGGAPCFFNGMDAINAAGISIFLDVSIDVLLKRVERTTHRPLLRGEEQNQEETLLELLAKRRPFYTKANITVTDATAPVIINALRREKLI